ncbi:hypothetical protein [Brevundimonas sp. Root1279]|uniref:hypothetical protein n=1 Tax=Brevundimonas sp. Root1279 TaxID=1736443 RepID=UPI0006F3BC5B|nr:hypothetical protein [Brevundimonas sp. Root1279]KQW82466.1 hypothetical protein ASC65_09505 [Brevundimonas sp. Root1279]
MSNLFKSIAIAAVVLLAPGVAAAQTWTEFTETQGRALVDVENGVVNEVSYDNDGLQLWVTFDDWMQVVLIGTDCEGEGAKQKCKSLGVNGLFEVDDVVHSRELESRLSYQYVADAVEGDDYVIHRQIELEGGASLANIRAQLTGFIIVGEKVYQDIWPSKDSPTAAPPAPSKSR